MTKRRKAVLWFGVMASALAIYYLGSGLVFYIRLHAAGLQQWDLDRPDILAVGVFVVIILSVGICISCLLSLINEARIRKRDKQNAT